MSLILPPQPKDFKFAEAKSPRLRILIWSELICRISVKGITKTGFIHDSFDSFTGYALFTRYIPLTEIPLSVTISTDRPQISRGQLYATMFLEFSNQSVTTLAADYITSHHPICYPTSSITSMTEGLGYLHSLHASTPFAGQDLSFMNDTDTLYLIHDIRFTLTTSATIATRTVRLFHIRMSEFNSIISIPNSSQTASLTREYFFTKYNNIPLAFGTHIFGELQPFYLVREHILASLCENLQPDDQFTNIELLLESWISP